MSSYRRRLMLANQTEENLVLYGNSVQDKTPAPEAPIDIMSVENPTVKACGNNLFNNDFSLLKDVMYVNTSGTKTTRKGYEIKLPAGTYIMKPYLKSGATSSNAYCYACLVDKDRNYKQKLNLVEQTYLPPQTPFNIENGDILLIYDGISGHTSEQAQVYFERYDIMLNLGATALPYEPYEGEEIFIEGYILRGTGDYKDRIYTQDGKVWFEQNIQYMKPTRLVSANSNSATISQFSENKKPKVTSDSYPYVSDLNQMSNIGVYQVTYNKTGELHWYLGRDNAYIIPPDSKTWTNTTDAYEYLMNVTGNVQMEYQYPLATPITTEITGEIAEKILAVDKTKNITISSENGVWGSVEVIDG